MESLFLEPTGAFGQAPGGRRFGSGIIVFLTCKGSRRRSFFSGVAQCKSGSLRAQVSACYKPQSNNVATVTLRGAFRVTRRGRGPPKQARRYGGEKWDDGGAGDGESGLLGGRTVSGLEYVGGWGPLGRGPSAKANSAGFRAPGLRTQSAKRDLTADAALQRQAGNRTSAPALQL